MHSYRNKKKIHKNSLCEQYNDVCVRASVHACVYI